MGTSRRLALLLLTVLSAVMGPPSRPPGGNPMQNVLAHTAPCPKPNCGTLTMKEANLYRCDACGGYFRYCSQDDTYFPNSEAAYHQHASG